MLLSPESRILVTGGAGFIGSAVVWELNQRGCENIVISDRLGTDEKWRNLVALKYADYVDGLDLLAALPKVTGAGPGRFDLIVHLGACSATTEKDSDYLMRNNFDYTRQLCQWALAQDTRFVYASSAATYGDGAHGMDDQLQDLSVLRPLNMYGYSKHLFDQYAAKQGWLEKIVGLKYFNVYGPNEDHKADMRSVVHKAWGQIRSTGRIQLFRSHRPDYEDGKQQRDFLYVKDAIRMTLHLAQTHTAGGLFNLGSGVPHTWVDLAEAIFAAAGLPTDIEFVDMPEALRAKYQYFTCADISKLRSTGYKDEVASLADSVKDYVVNYLVDDRRLGD
ncbi:MAG: ADP-glyceromanno-heptose 6-epimerase [Verrucomicrobiales bacterium]|nr:ADP-glyceromanno-heptose 6-epimerase [Verrucomicrobiales bacterium]MCP5558734.1 ADP-glyceromanno-heptose 6-epimerase [Verrucomicrobiaceae bacterium]